MKKIKLLYFLVFVILLGVSPVIVNAQIISTLAGCGIGDDSIATRAELLSPVAMCFDHAGNAYVSDAGHYRVRKITPAGMVSTFAGTGVYGYNGDGGPAIAANIGIVYGVAADKAGNIYIVDNAFNCIRKVDVSGTITTVAGTGTAGYSGDGGPAIAAQLNAPIDILVDTSGNLIFTDWYNGVVRKINTAGTITTIVGDGTVGTGTGNHGSATASELGAPFRVTMDNKGNLYVAEVYFQCICKVDTGGILTVIADTTGNYATGTDGDGGSALIATMTSPCGLAVDTSGNLYFSDIGNYRIRKIDMTTGIISNYAANGIQGFGGNGGAATAAEINVPEGLASDSAGNIYICDDENNEVRVVNTANVMGTFMGRNGIFDQGYAAANTELDNPTNVAADAAGNIYVADNANNRVLEINASTGIVTNVGGSGIGGYSGDGGPATAADIASPYGVAVDKAGNIYIADINNSRVRKVSAAGIMTTLAGNGVFGFAGDGGPATASELSEPTGVAVDAAGNVYIADYGNSVIRKVDNTGMISTVAGMGTAVGGFSGDGGPATAAQLDSPIDVATDGIGNLYIIDYLNNLIRMVDTSGTINTIIGLAGYGFSGDGGPALTAQMAYPTAIKADSIGDVFFCDEGNQRIRMINTAGYVYTIAGNGTAGFSGDGGPATAAKLNNPWGVAIDGSGNLFIGDQSNDRVRKVTIGYLSAPQTALANNNIQVYPNPAHDQVTVAATTLTGNSMITMYDVVGHEVYKMPFLLNKQVVNINDLASGVYMLRVTNNGEEVKTVKVTKE